MEKTEQQKHKVVGFVCDICGKYYENKPPYNKHPDITTGYGTKEGQIVCYACCADADKQA